MKQRRLSLLTLVLCTALVGAGFDRKDGTPNAPLPRDDWPPSGDFNGMSVNYSISGATITSVSDPKVDYTWKRSVEGKLGTGTLRVSGVAKSGGIPDYPTAVSVRVWAGDKATDFRGTIKGDPTINPRPKFPLPFDVSVDIPASATTGGVDIYLTGYYNVGERVLAVSATFTRAGSPPPEAPPAVPVRPAPPVRNAVEAYADFAVDFTHGFDNACFAKAEGFSLGDTARFRSALNTKDLSIEDGTQAAWDFFAKHDATASTVNFTPGYLTGPVPNVTYLRFGVPLARAGRLSSTQRLTIWHESVHQIEALHADRENPNFGQHKVYRERNAAYLERLIGSLADLQQAEDLFAKMPSGSNPEAWAEAKSLAVLNLPDIAQRIRDLEAGVGTEEAFVGKLGPGDVRRWPPDLRELRAWTGINAAFKVILDRYASGACGKELQELALAELPKIAGAPAAKPIIPKVEPPSLIKTGQAFYAKSLYAEADKAFTAAIAADPRSAQAYAGRGLARRGLNQLDGALADVDRALQLDPTSADAYRGRSMVRRAQNDFGNALADATRAVELAPSDNRAYLTRGLARQELNDLDGAIRDFSRGIALDPSYPSGYTYRGKARLDTKDYAGALADLNRYIEMNPNEATAFNNRGMAKQRLGDLAGARSDYERALSINPSLETTRNNLASLSAAPEVEVFNSNNVYGVASGPTVDAVFTLSQPHVITSIWTYHWNNGRGTGTGTIALRNANGRAFGPWPVTGTAGQGGVPNANWTCTPNVELPAGTYRIVDSEPATWSRNTQSGGRGFAVVKGRPVGSGH